MADFVTSEDHLTLLAEVHKLEFDRKSDVFAKHPLTTDEIKQSCEDVKVSEFYKVCVVVTFVGAGS